MTDNIVTFPNTDREALDKMKAMLENHEFLLLAVTEEGISLGFSKHMTPAIAQCVATEAVGILTSAGVMELFAKEKLEQQEELH